MPYWDWARKDVAIFPEDALTNNKNSFRGPPSSASVDAQYNPLFQAPFQDGTPKNITVRFPFSLLSANPRSCTPSPFAIF
jgi:hypothetical protein